MIEYLQVLHQVHQEQMHNHLVQVYKDSVRGRPKHQE
jgi:hypothetical protein